MYSPAFLPLSRGACCGRFVSQELDEYVFSPLVLNNTKIMSPPFYGCSLLYPSSLGVVSANNRVPIVAFWWNTGPTCTGHESFLFCINIHLPTLDAY